MALSRICLDDVPYFEVEDGDDVRLFINGVERCCAKPRSGRCYFIVVPDFAPLRDDEDWPFDY